MRDIHFVINIAQSVSRLQKSTCLFSFLHVAKYFFFIKCIPVTPLLKSVDKLLSGKALPTPSSPHTHTRRYAPSSFCVYWPPIDYSLKIWNAYLSPAHIDSFIPKTATASVWKHLSAPLVSIWPPAWPSSLSARLTRGSAVFDLRTAGFSLLIFAEFLDRSRSILSVISCLCPNSYSDNRKC